MQLLIVMLLVFKTSKTQVPCSIFKNQFNKGWRYNMTQFVYYGINRQACSVVLRESPLKHTGYCMSQCFDIKMFWIFPTQCLGAIRIILTKNGNYFPMRYWLFGLCNGCALCFLWGGYWMAWWEFYLEMWFFIKQESEQFRLLRLSHYEVHVLCVCACVHVVYM